MKVKIKTFLHWVKYSWSEQAHYTLLSSDYSKVDPDYVCLGEREIELEVPDDFNPVPHQVAAMRAKQTEILAEAQAQVTNIEETIQRLLCIEHKPEVA